jgi:hypothetical protein
MQKKTGFVTVTSGRTINLPLATCELALRGKHLFITNTHVDGIVS